MKRIQSHKGVIGTVVVNSEGDDILVTPHYFAVHVYTFVRGCILLYKL